MNKKLSPFDFIGNLSGGSKSVHLLADDAAYRDAAAPPDSNGSAYTPFMINRGFSYFNDSVFLANEMNRHASLPSRMQYDFYRNTLRQRKRFSKWSKAPSDSADVTVVAQAYGVSKREARLYIKLLSESDLSALKIRQSYGGK